MGDDKNNFNYERRVFEDYAIVMPEGNGIILLI